MYKPTWKYIARREFQLLELGKNIISSYETLITANLIIIILISIICKWNQAGGKYLESPVPLTLSFFLILNSTDVFEVSPGLKQKLVPMFADGSRMKEEWNSKGAAAPPFHYPSVCQLDCLWCCNICPSDKAIAIWTHLSLLIDATPRFFIPIFAWVQKMVLFQKLGQAHDLHTFR